MLSGILTFAQQKNQVLASKSTHQIITTKQIFYPADYTESTWLKCSNSSTRSLLGHLSFFVNTSILHNKSVTSKIFFEPRILEMFIKCLLSAHATAVQPVRQHSKTLKRKVVHVNKRWRRLSLYSMEYFTFLNVHVVWYANLFLESFFKHTDILRSPRTASGSVFI